MARWWTEPYDAARHPNKMPDALDGHYSHNFDETPCDNLIARTVYFVAVCQFTFEFQSLRQLEIALEYFQKEHRGSTRIDGGIGSADHWEVQRWFECLPKGMERKNRREKIAIALGDALTSFRAA